MISVILNAFRRTDFLEEQIQAIKDQSIKVEEILVWCNNDKNLDIKKSPDITYCDCNKNFGVWSRFSLALNCKSPFIAIFDDDTFPGKDWFKNCLKTIEECNGLLGARGVRFSSGQKYFIGEEFGWNNPNEKVKEVDIVGHAWFFRREWLSTFWRELPDHDQSSFVGEDIHFSYTLQKYLGLKTYVPPHSKTKIDEWGSNPDIALRLGTDSNSISYNPIHQKEMNDAFVHYLDKGFKVNPNVSLRIKGSAKDLKSKIGKIIKKI